MVLTLWVTTAGRTPGGVPTTGRPAAGPGWWARPPRRRGLTRYGPCRGALVVAALVAGVVVCAAADSSSRAAVPAGVVRLQGSPEDIGREHGTRLAGPIRTMIGEYVRDDLAPPWPGPGVLDRVRRMKAVVPEWYRRELAACAQAAGIEEDVLLYAQCEGDIKSLGGCTSYVALGPATHDGRMEIGRNFDYWGLRSTRECVTVLAVIPRPEEGYAFVAVGWAGILGGWTLYNERGLFVSNNLGGFSATNPDGIPTLILTRMLIQKAATLDDAVAIVRRGPRMRGQALVIGSAGDPGRGRAPGAAVIQYDAERVEVAPAVAGMALHSSVGSQPEPLLSVLGRPPRQPWEAIRSVGNSITLHSVAIRPQEGRMWVAHGRPSSAHEGAYVGYDLRALLAR